MLKLKKETHTDYQSKTYRLPIDLLLKIDELATKNNTSATKVVIQCLEYALEHIDDDEPAETAN